MPTVKSNELPYQTYERVTGKKWGSDPSVYKTYGVSAPAGSMASNLELQNKINRPILNASPLAPAPIKSPTIAPIKSVVPASITSAPTAPVVPTVTPAPSATPGMVSLTNKTTGQTVSVSKLDYDTNASYKDPSSPWSAASALPAESAVDKATREYYTNLPRVIPNDTTDKDAIRESVRKQMQNQIDAINQTYDSMVATDTTAGENRSGQTRALSSRSGMLGAPMGDQQKAETDSYNKSIIDGDNAARNDSIAKVWANIDQRSDDLYNNKRTDAVANSEKYINYLKTSQDSARSDMLNLAKSGQSVDSLNEDDYKKLLEQTGYDPLVFKSIWNSNTPDKQKRDYNYINLGNGKVAAFSVNPATNKMEKEEYSVDIGPNQEIKEFDGMPYIVNKDASGNLSLQNIKSFDYGANKKTDTVELRGGLFNIKTNKWVVQPKATAGATEKLTTDELGMIANQKVAPQLDAVKGTDGYISASDYRKARNSYVASGLSAKNFDDNFSVYVNPNLVEQYDLVGKKLSRTAQ